eukprot:RCo007178
MGRLDILPDDCLEGVLSYVHSHLLCTVSRKWARVCHHRVLTIRAKASSDVPQGEALQRLLRCQYTRSVTLLLGHRVTPTVLQTYLDALPKGYPVEKLEVVRRKLDLPQLQSISRSLGRFPTLTELSLDLDEVQFPSPVWVQELLTTCAVPAGLRTLSLSLSSCRVGDRGATALALGLPKVPSLSLDLFNNQLSSEGIQTLLQGLLTNVGESLTSLELDLRGNPVTAEGLACLKVLVGFPRLQKLTLMVGPGMPTASVPLRELTRCPHLRVLALHLAENEMGDEAADDLLVLKDCPALTHLELFLGYNLLQDDSAVQLCRLLDAPGLSRLVLDVHHNDLTDDAADAFLKHLSEMTPAGQGAPRKRLVLDIRENSLTRLGIDKLKRARCDAVTLDCRHG